MFLTLLVSILSLISLSVQQKDPLEDFCRLFGHQTTVVDRNLYIDGGLVNWSPVSASSLNYSSTWIKAGNLDENNEGFPQQAILAKNETVPSVHGGILWSDAANKVLYQYGGEYGNGKPEDFKLWFYDIIYNTWNISNATTTDISRASWGAGATVQDKGRGYYYGGWLSDASVPGYAKPTLLNNMIIYDMAKGSFRNSTGPQDMVPRAEGAMVYIPAGDAGLLVYFGGVQLANGDSKVSGAPMSDIQIYDVGNEKWYSETATGDVPEDRRRFCAGAAWADDRSSYNIYLYGGASIDKGVGYGDVYVLSLPSFKWIKFWPRAEDNIGAVFPHHSLSCDVIGSQMIIMGGHFTNSSDCDVPTVYGQHGLNLGQLKPDEPKWASFNPKLTAYKVPKEIVQTIGGNSGGAANLTAPTGGYKNRDLKVQFSRAYTPAVREATRFIPSATAPANPQSPTAAPEKSNKSAVIGGAVGGTAGGLFVIAGIWVCCILHRRKKAKNSQGGHISEADSHPMNHPTNYDMARSMSQQTRSTNYDMARSLSTQTRTTAFDTPNIHKGPDDMWTQYSRAARAASENGYSGPPTPATYAEPVPPVPPVLYEMPAASTVYEMPDTRSPPSFSKPFHAQPEKFAKKFQAPAIDPYYAQNPPGTPTGVPTFASASEEKR